MEDGSWIIESILQFTHSPLWRTPINNFVDDNCFLFSTDEMTVEQTEVHLAFRNLADNLITAFVEELGVPLETVLEVVHKHVNEQSPLQQPAEKFLHNLFYMDDFRSFHKMMMRRNIQLDVIASRILEHQKNGRVGETSPEEEVMMDEEAALHLAIKASLEDEETARKMMELEDMQIQEALALSIAAEEERLRRRSGTMKKGVKKQVTDVKVTGTEHVVKEKLGELVEAEECIIEKLEARALEVRKETMKRNISVSQNVAFSGSGDLSAEKVTAPEGAAKQQQDVSPAPAPATDKPPTKKIVPPFLPSGKVFGFKTLPSIQPSFKQLESVVLGTAMPPSPQSGKQSGVTPAAAVSPPTMEEMEERARHMREQREKILARNKANRDKELNDYSVEGEKSNVKPSSIQEGEKQMMLELARRLREDIVREATK
ncbi:putative coiled-coil domain-containing protein 104 [Trypanosoma rangeli]|uniref:Cilia- and flagella-associated protein 36 n=1 Tax=Trypanosoma rangeli TaxID=5698 RepID=A0A3R7MMF8_TRYRA|nr:putative coiled-coil domain-containing protein 104 [Trypanosoma rangeli]RNF05158.1 putative coiled-coil domain-containing protein 104 [Trypanosoma rangeli]|eukprot:RNF05158.1 putative coiled-coil domain-containing protein 104 [Trypanosoma rangeli]